MKAKLADMAFDLGLFKLVASFTRGRGAMLMLHEIHADEEIARFDGCTSAQLDWMLATLRKWDIDLISADELLPRLRSDNPRQFVVVTLDDGYRDNLMNALPILERHGAPALINVPTEAVTRELFCWWLGLRELFMTRDTLDIQPAGRRFDLSSSADRLEGYKWMQAWISADFMRAGELRSWFEASGISFPQLCDRFFMDEAEVRTCAAHPLITIGGHSRTHRPLAALDEAEMRDELSGNRSYLEDLLQAPVLHMAYPFGGTGQCGPREARAAREAGYETAIAVRRGRLSAASADDPYLLPREDVGYRGMTERQLYGIINGLYGIQAVLTGA